MNVQTISNHNLNSLYVSKKPKSDKSNNVESNYQTNPIKEDNFTPQSQEFNLDNSIKMLSKIKNKDGKEKFHQGQLANLENYLIEEPKKWNSMYLLAQNPNMKGDFVYLMASKPLEHLDTLAQIANTKDKKGNYKYSGKEMMNFNDNIVFEDLKSALPLIKTSLPVKNIIQLAQAKNIPSLEKISDKVLEMENLVGNSLEEITFTRDKFDKEAFVLSAKTSNNAQKTQLLDKNLKTEALEDLTKYKNKNEKEYVIKKTVDYRNNTVSKVRLREDADVGRPVFENEVRIVKDKNNKIHHYEYVSPSSVNGVFDIRYKTPEGKEKIVSSGKIDKKTGIVSVKKDLKSPDGTHTQYLYENDPQGNRIVDYKITDKNGKVLMNKSQTFEIVNENKFISSTNDKKYEINIKDNKIFVQDLQNKENKAILDANEEVLDNKNQLFNILKHFSGDELLKMKKTIDLFEYIDNPLDSYYNGSSRVISTGNDAFLLLHELGHARDFRDVQNVSLNDYEKEFKKSITMDKEVNKIFEEEKANFFKKYPEAQRMHIEYFMDTLTHYNGETGGLQETIAETNALLQDGISYEPLAIRSQYLQQNFPKTIAILETKLND